VKLVKFTDTGKILGRIKLERANPRADLIIGLTPTSAKLAKSENLLKKYGEIRELSQVDSQYIFDKEGYVIPYDFGGLAIVYNPNKISNNPSSFEDIIKMKKQLIISDPRTSSTGQDFLLWTIAIYKNDWKDFWKKLKPAILNVTSGWSEAFSKFEAGEASMMLSYATDGAYAFYNYNSTKYKTFVPQEGGYIQKEGAAIVNGSKNPELAKKFLIYLLSDKFQKEIPLNQWMFPVKKMKLPPCFDYAIKIDNTVGISEDQIQKNLQKWLDEWEKIMK